MYLGINDDGHRVLLNSTDLLTHGVILGRTGSGKTGLTLTVLEEAASSGASAIVFDPKGDLTNLAVMPSSEEAMHEWVDGDHDEIWTQRVDGLARFGLSVGDVAKWQQGVNVVVYSPGKTFGGGRSINVFPDMAPQANVTREAAMREVATILSAVGEGNDQFGPAHVLLTELVLLAWSYGDPMPVDDWPTHLLDPPQSLQSIDGMKLGDFFPKRNRTALARKLIGFRRQAERWLIGERLDLDALTSKPTVAIMTMRHLTEKDRQFFTSLVMNRVVDFMFRTDASSRLKLLVTLDEARGYLPPYPVNPPTKEPICTILAQGRAQGIGMLIGTQNPMDLDYKALSNVGTWFAGRLRERDCNRDLSAELNARDVDVEALQNLAQRRFLLLDKRGGHQALTVRWPYSYLKGPLSAHELARLEGQSEPKIVVTPKQVVRPQKVTLELMRKRRKFWGQIFGWG